MVIHPTPVFQDIFVLLTTPIPLTNIYASMSHDPPTCSNTPALGSTSSVHICRSSLRGQMDPEFNEAKIPAFATKGRSQIYKGSPNQAISRCYPGFYCYCVCLDQLLRFGNGITPYLQLQIVLCQDGVSLRHSAIDGQNAAPGNDTNIGQFITYTE